MDPSMSMPATPSTSPMSGMSGMASTFSINTKVTLLFTDWTTNTAAKYAFTVLFLFFLGMLNRFLGALRSQLERRWNENRESARNGNRKHEKRHSLNIPNFRTAKDVSEELQPLSPMPETVMDEKAALRSKKRFFVANAAWSMRRDSVRALLEFVRAVVGYVLMLAVMTYNVGFFFAVTGSVLLGELVFGRYAQSGHTGWQEGGCHE